METSSASQVIIIIMVILIIIIIIITIVVKKINVHCIIYSHLLKVLDIRMEHKLNLKLKRIKCPDSWDVQLLLMM